MEIEKAKVAKLFDNSYVILNVINHNKIDFLGEENIYLKFNNTVYRSVAIDNFEKCTIGINTFVRTHLGLGINDIIPVQRHLPVENIITHLHFKILSYNNKSEIHIFHEEQIKEEFIKKFKGYYLYTNQCLYFDIKDIKLIVYITNIIAGYCSSETIIQIQCNDVSINLVGSKLMKRDLFRDDYNFEEIGIGGLDKELISVLRRCLSTRSYKQATIDKLGIKHVKGMLLYGPPGCGKTLIARKIGSLISNKSPKVVNGPEIMSKYVGEAEKNVRELFADAMSDKSQELHIIIFDEIDAICKKRGSGSGREAANDGIVNQMLTMIDGYTTLNNIFIIGLTNRKDLLDEALLRAGRLEVHIEIGLPNKRGRDQIFQIHTNTMRTNKMIEDLDINLFSELTENYSGAEIEAVVRNAAARALHEGLVVNEKEENIDIVIKKRHFIESISEVIPTFGKVFKEASSLIPDNYQHLSNKHKDCYEEILKLIKTKTKRINCVLIHGENRNGKTVLALKTALDSKIKNTKIIRAIDLISLDEVGKALYISDIVKTSYISDESLIVIDDIEIAINYVQLGSHPLFSNRLYQVLITILKTEPISSLHNITFICTCTDEVFSQSIGKFFDLILNI